MMIFTFNRKGRKEVIHDMLVAPLASFAVKINVSGLTYLSLCIIMRAWET